MTRLRELTLDEMLADPIVHLVMRRDGVEESHIRALVARLREGRSWSSAPSVDRTEPRLCALA